MSAAADARERLEAGIWRVLGEYSPCPRVHHVDRILTLADAYARAGVDDDPSPRLTRRRERLERLAGMRLHDSSHPEPSPGAVTNAQAAEQLGVSERTVERYKRELAAGRTA
jgi:hypothetical protein